VPLCPRCQARHLPELHCWSGRYAARIRDHVLATKGTTCCHCHEDGARSVEHVTPRSKGGTDHDDNLRPAHLVCNQRRARHPMLGWTDRPTTSRDW
jgi:5-methylcytosine-specific restriction endonuclease McrA